MQHTDSPSDSQPPARLGELRLTDILAHRSSVLWHEAVGVVLSVAEVAGAVEPIEVPPTDAAVLCPDGSVRVEAHGPGRTPPVAQLRGWLNELLQESPAPPPLVDLAQEGDSASETFEAFVEALRYFSRPNRREELAALVRRINAERHVAPIEQELAALTAKISQPKPASAKPQPRKTIPSLWSLVAALGRSRVAGIAVAGTILALAFPVVAWRAWVASAPLPVTNSWPADLVAPSAAATAAQPTAKVVKPSVSFLRSAPVASRRTTPPAGTRRTRQPASPVVAASGLPNGLATAIIPQAVPVQPSFAEYATDTHADSTPEPAAPPPPVAPTPSRVFTPDDPDVVQPVLLSSSLPTPSVPGAEAGGVTVIDLVIDEHGRVDRATLASPAMRFEERMLLSAVKAWRFRPATKDGAPVKYRARVTLTL